MSYTFATRTTGLRSSAIRDLLKVTEMSDMLSLAGGLPTPDSFPLADLRREADRLLGEELHLHAVLVAGDDGKAWLEQLQRLHCAEIGGRLGDHHIARVDEDLCQQVERLL